MQAEQYQEARTLFQQSIAIEPSSDGYYNLGNCHFILGDSTAALENWQLSLSKPSSDAFVNIANVLARKGQLADALVNFQKAAELDPEDGQIHYNHGVVLESASKLEEAIESYQKARKLGVNRADVNLRNALAKLAGKQLDSPE